MDPLDRRADRRPVAITGSVCPEDAALRPPPAAAPAGSARCPNRWRRLNEAEERSLMAGPKARHFFPAAKSRGWNKRRPRHLLLRGSRIMSVPS